MDIIKLALVVLVSVMLGFFGARMVDGQNVGGATNYDYVDTTDGYYVDGIAVIDGSGNYDGAITGTTATIGTTTVENLTTGGDLCTITDANGGKSILTVELLKRCGRFEMAAGGAGQAVIQLEPQPTSTMASGGFIPNAGDCKSFFYSADALAAGTTTTMTATTGVNVIGYTTNDDVVDGDEFSEWLMCRNSSTDVDWIVTEILHAD